MRTVAEIVENTNAIRHWIDVQIRDGRDDDWIVAMLPHAAAFICGDLGHAALLELLHEARRS